VPKRERALFRTGNATPANRAPWDGKSLIEDCVDVRLARSAIRARAVQAETLAPQRIPGPHNR